MGGSKSKTSTLSPQQSALLQPLADWIKPFLQPNAQLDDLESRLLGSTSAESKALAERTFREGILTPALREFDRTQAPAIAGGFANYGGSLSSRRGLALSRARSDVFSAAEDTLGRNLLAIRNNPLQQTLAQIQGFNNLQTARLQPFQSALQLALSPTRNDTRSSSSPLPSILGAAGTIVGAVYGGPAGATGGGYAGSQIGNVAGGSFQS